MQSGRKKHKIQVFQKTEELDEFGKTLAPKFLFNIRCNVQIISGTEILKNGMLMSSEYVSTLANYDRRLKKDHVFIWKGGEYNIDMIRPDEREKDMIITASREF